MTMIICGANTDVLNEIELYGTIKIDDEGIFLQTDLGNVRCITPCTVEHTCIQRVDYQSTCYERNIRNFNGHFVRLTGTPTWNGTDKITPQSLQNIHLFYSPDIKKASDFTPSPEQTLDLAKRTLATIEQAKQPTYSIPIAVSLDVEKLSELIVDSFHE